ncbi:MAG: membrane protease YdiL (CAAX protease family) [Bacteroidia bacterium]|jgi:membrane protease YdiL (CAAX protease family)
MQNRLQSRVSGISHFFLAIGILILSLFAMTGISFFVIQTGMGLQMGDLTNISLDQLTIHKAFALKLAQFIIALSFVIAGFICTKTFRQDFLSFTGLKSNVKIKHLIIAFGLLLALIPTVDALVRFNASWTFPGKFEIMFTDLEAKSNHTYDLFLKHNQGSHFIMNLVIMSLLAGIGEEIFFRGILMRVLSKWANNVHVGILLSAVLFTIIHFQPYKFLPMLAFGVFLGYLYYRTKSLWIPIIVHAINNAIVVVGDWYIKNGNTASLFDEDYTFSSIVLAVSLISLAVLGYVFWKQTNDNNFDYA